MERERDIAERNSFVRFLALSVHVHLEPVHVAPPWRAFVDGGAKFVQEHLNGVQTSLHQTYIRGSDTDHDSGSNTEDMTQVLPPSGL